MLIAKDAPERIAVTLERVKEHLRIDHDADDSLLESHLKAGIKQVETLTGWSLSTTEYEWTIEEGDLKKSIPLYPAKITSDHEMVGGYVKANAGDVVEFKTSISHHREELEPAVLLYVQFLYEAMPDDQEKLMRVIRGICGIFRRNLGL